MVQLKKNASVDEEEYNMMEQVRELMVVRISMELWCGMGFGASKPKTKEVGFWRHDLIDHKNTYCFWYA